MTWLCVRRKCWWEKSGMRSIRAGVSGRRWRVVDIVGGRVVESGSDDKGHHRKVFAAFNRPVVEVVP